MLVPIAIVIIAGLLGLAFGSFLNVCIVRLPLGESVVSPRSQCRACQQPVANRDNIPLLSYVLLRGRCRGCGASIPALYPAVEAAVALWFVLSSTPLLRAVGQNAAADALLQSAVHSTAMAVFGFLLIGLAVMDWRTGLLPNEFTLGGLAAGVLFTFAESFFVAPVAVKTLFTPEEVFIAHRLLAAVVGFLLLWLVGALYRVVRHRPGMGGGDPKLLAMMGSFLGLGGLGVAFLAGTALATVAAILLLVRRHATGGTALRFGSFLAAGGLVAAVWGERLADWYMQLFR